MQKTLADFTGRATVLSRVQRLTPGSTRQWGRMTPHQAICHLSDSFRSLMNPTPPRSVSTLFSRTVIKWIALRVPAHWPRGVKTLPEVDQEVGGTRPIEFLRDRRELEALIEQFGRRTCDDCQPHPIFGRLTTDELQRWGYRHVDHHLRQFGV